MSTKVRRHVFSRDPSVLGRIADEGLDLAVWVRRAPSRAKRFTRFCPPSMLPDRTFVAGLADDILPSVLASTHWADKHLPHFAADVAMLAALFRASTGAKNLRIRLERVTGDGCRLFHADRVRARMICTYRGAGTQWLPEHAAMRDGLAKGSNALIVRDEHLVRRMTPWAVALVKGELWTGRSGAGLVHRSPPVASAFEARLVLVIDDADVAYK